MFCAAFLANLCNNLSYILYRKFPIYFASVFSAILNDLFVLYRYIENFLYNVFDKMLLKLVENTCEKNKLFFSKRRLIIMTKSYTAWLMILKQAKTLRLLLC